MRQRNYKHIVYFLVIAFSWSCGNKNKLVRLIIDYSSGSGWGYSYSIKVYTNGTAYLKKFSVKKIDTLWVKKEVDVNRLNAIVSRAREVKLAARYEQQNIEDASSFDIIFHYSNGKISKHHIYGHYYPELFAETRKYCDSLAQETGWSKLRDTTVVFESLSTYFNVSKLKLGDSVKFPPPLLRSKK